jgi:hypothetical protein
MKKSILKAGICLAICVMMILSFAGCQVKFSKASEVNIVEKLNSLTTSDTELGVNGKYEKLSDIKDGKIDADLLGTWVTSDGTTSYAFAKDGTVTATVEGMDEEVKATFTCVKVKDYNILCEEMKSTSEDSDGNVTEGVELAYTAYKIENDVLYQVAVLDTSYEFDSSNLTLLTMYREDKVDEAMANNPIAVDSINGTWSSDEGDIVIDNGILKCGDDEFKISFNEKNQLVATKDGKSTTYDLAISAKKFSDEEDTVSLSLSFTGKDKDDRPNLEAVLIDWKAEYEYDSYYFNSSFDLKK